ncbi:hypothetical protein [Acetatifactor muris]|uniref:hypothetical protein n=1 Tax=Acetatifactor muris TaxID=879566 RepID=UPI0023F038D2|nr:hypothetical protein [Acetatifactor muris]
MDNANLTEVCGNLEDMGSSLPEHFCRMVIRRMEGIGYTAWDTTGLWNLAFGIQKAEQEILDYCHIDVIPKKLYPMLCDRSCGQYLYGLKQSGKLEIEGIDLSGILTSLTEGDVKVDFDKGASDETRLDVLLGMMMNSGKGQLTCYRKLRF